MRKKKSLLLRFRQLSPHLRKVFESDFKEGFPSHLLKRISLGPNKKGLAVDFCQGDRNYLVLVEEQYTAHSVPGVKEDTAALQWMLEESEEDEVVDTLLEISRKKSVKLLEEDS